MDRCGWCDGNIRKKELATTLQLTNTKTNSICTYRE